MKALRTILYLMLLIGVLSACNLPMASDQSLPTEQPTPLPASQESPTQVSAGESGAAKPSPEPSEPIPATEEPAEPEVTETVPPPPQDDSANQPQSACDHPYFPLRLGATWTYRDEVNFSNLLWTVTEVTGDLETAQAVMVALVYDDDEEPEEGFELVYHWQCSNEGITSFDYVGLNNLNTGQGEFTMEMNEMSGEGVFIPAPALLFVDSTWSQMIEGEFSMNIMDTISADGTLAIEEDHRVLSTSPIEFDGMLTDGFTIERVSRVGATIIMNGVSTSLPNVDTDITNIYTLAYGIGIVHQRAETDFSPSEIRLVSYNIP